MALIYAHDRRHVIVNTLDVLIIIGNVQPNSRQFRLTPYEYQYNCDVRGIVPCYTLDAVQGGNDVRNTFYAYYCPYVQNGIQSIRVGQLLDYFFTAPLNGCSLGFGIPDETGTRVIAHANSIDAVPALVEEQHGIATARAQQAQHQAMRISGLMPVHEKIIHPSDYGQLPDDINPLVTTLIGIRNTRTGTWEFIRQTYNRSQFIA